jgi:hypothetical protein
MYWAWAVEASHNVSLPDALISVRRGRPAYSYQEKTMWLPWVGHNGYTADFVQASFFHELGHVFDDWNMTVENRRAFKAIIGVTCRWNDRNCITPIYYRGELVNMLRLAPLEMFAEEYVACAFGLTQEGYQLAGNVNYGWLPPAGTDAELCAFMRKT